MPDSNEVEWELARAFLDVAHALGRYRFDHWGEMTHLERRRLEDDEWSLLTYSSGLTTVLVSRSLDDMQAELRAIKGAAEQARRVIDTVQTVKTVLKVAAAFASLGGAVVVGNALAFAAASDAALASLEVEKAARPDERYRRNHPIPDEGGSRA